MANSVSTQTAKDIANTRTVKLNNRVSTPVSGIDVANYEKVATGWEHASTNLGSEAQRISDGITLTMSSLFVGIGIAAKTKGAKSEPVIEPKTELNNEVRTSTASENRFNRKYLFSLRLGEYFMPLSQTFNLRAKKRLNVSSLVDGIDIIQQTRHQAKVIDCSLRLTLRSNQPNLEIVTSEEVSSSYYDDLAKAGEYTDLPQQLDTFASFLQDLYENDAVFEVDNQMINDVFGVRHAFISEYTFKPQTGRFTFQFDFTLTEVKYGDDVLTQDVLEIR